VGANRVIDVYLEQLDTAVRSLGRRARTRIVSEAREHLLDAAGEVGAVDAVDRFGPADEVGRAHISAAGTGAPRRAIAVFGAAGLGYGLIQLIAAPPTFGLFPPGPWPNDQPPPHLAWKVDLAGAMIAVAFVIGVASIVTAWRRRRLPVAERAIAVRLAFIGSIVFAASWPFEALFLFQRSHEVAGSPGDVAVAIVTGGLLGCQGIAVVSVNRSRRLMRAATH
jgi:hypothetical protein